MGAHLTNSKAGDIGVRRVDTTSEFGTLRETWNNLLSESPGNNFFLRWEWLWNWWKAYGEEDFSLSILIVHRGDEVIGIAPFYTMTVLWKKFYPIRRLMFLGTIEGSVISEYMDIICRKGCESAVVKKVMEHIVDSDVCDDIYFQKMDTSSSTGPLLRSAADETGFLHLIQEVSESPYISLPADYAAYVGSVSSSMRRKIRSNAARVYSHPGVMLRKTETARELYGDYQDLVRLHLHRWATQKALPSFSGKFHRFQEMVTSDMLRDGHLQLWFLSVSGRNIAALYNILYNGKIYFYQSGLDTMFDRKISPGFFLHCHCIREAIGAGLREYDFLLRGKKDSYKLQWAKDLRYQCDVYMARPWIIKLMHPLEKKVKSLYKALKISGPAGPQVP